ncbi:pleckstrin homology domain-containing family F member 1-like [Protopterus annectens]|uniref:pleckstrin homology domain-containing family F member 1-like n=1 Tax=Protopterus annectens TaxID=7888 RepID=UPI001CFA3B17|nr:pleckstrin homology domain-containing family F member 1-like [Protopterus annectens]
MGDILYSQTSIKHTAIVENCFGMSGQPLVKEGRILLCKGALKKECRKRGKLRIFFLFNDILVYGKILIMNRKYIKQRIIPLVGLTVETLPDLEEIKNRWLIKSEKKSFVVSAATLIEKKEWMYHIEESTKFAEMNTCRISNEEPAAVWISDKATDVCMRCEKNKFNFVRRKHHCRKCGLVVCGDCSKQKFSIPSISNKPQKVCLLCYKLLLSKERKKLEEQRTLMEQMHSFLQDNDSLIDDNYDNHKCGEQFDQWSEQEFDSPAMLWSAVHN